MIVNFSVASIFLTSEQCSGGETADSLFAADEGEILLLHEGDGGVRMKEREQLILRALVGLVRLRVLAGSEPTDGLAVAVTRDNREKEMLIIFIDQQNFLPNNHQK